jgi:hypothetical protein
VDRIVDLLRNEGARSTVVAALEEQNGLVVDFLTLLLKEEERQGADGKPAIAITDTQCKP